MSTSALFDRSRRKIIAAIMSVLVVLFAATLAAIYAFSYAEVYERDTNLLENYVTGFQNNRMPQGFDAPEEDSARPNDMRQQRGELGHRSAPFYAVVFDVDGNAVFVENTPSSGYSDGELVSFAQSAATRSDRTGAEGALMYAVERGGGYTLVGLMDNTLVTQSMGTLFRYTLIVGLIALVALFFVARWLAGRIVAPMQQAYETQRQFISDAGHDLKTPVSVVEANAELLQREIGDNPWLQNIRHENEQLGVLVGQLLELARAEERLTVKEQVNLSRVIEAELLSCEPLAFEKGVELQSSIEENLEVTGDASELTRLAAILLDNALSHGSDSAPIRLTLKRSGHHVRLTITNAITAEEATRLKKTDIFARFTRGNEARSAQEESKAQHYGLGLAIARAIVNAHGGTLEAAVDEHAPSIAFTVLLPAARS